MMETTLLILMVVVVYGIVNYLLRKLENQPLQFNLRLIIVLICLTYLYVKHFSGESGNLTVLIGLTGYFIGSFVWSYFKDRKQANTDKESL